MNEAKHLLQALCASYKEITVAGHSFQVWEFTLEQVADLLGELEALSTAGVSVVSIINPETGAKEDFFKTNWFKLAAEAKQVVYKMLAFALQIEAADAPTIAAKYLPGLLRAMYEVNESFFGELTAMFNQFRDKLPGVAQSLAGLQTNGSEPSESSNAAAGV